MELSRKHIVYTLGINNQISESSQLDKSLMLKILHEQLLYETFLDSIKKYADEKYNQVVDKFNEWKDMASVLGKVLSDSDLLNDFLKPLQRRVDNLIKPLTDFLKKIKLDSFIKPIEKFITEISSLEGWKKFMALVSVGSIITYIIEKLKSVTPEAVKELLAKTFSPDFISNILEKLTDFTSYLGWLKPIVKGVENIYIFLEPLLQAFKVALASGSKFATKLIKENNMNNKQLVDFLKEELDQQAPEGKLQGSINPQILKNLGITDVTQFTTVMNLVKNNKVLNPPANKILADIFIQIIKSDDDAELNKLFSNIKQLKTK
jgi:hypothetical protein